MTQVRIPRLWRVKSQNVYFYFLRAPSRKALFLFKTSPFFHRNDWEPIEEPMRKK
jgi:hypothetical protein